MDRLFKSPVKHQKGHRHVVFDIETTGLNPRHGHRIIEIGAILIEDRIIVDQFNTLIDAGYPISPGAQRVNGITEKMLAGQPKPEQIMPQFEEFIRESVLVAHNARFDVGFLRHEFHLQKISFSNPHICTMELSRKKNPNLPNHKLDTVYRYLCGSLPEGSVRHRALTDAHMAAAVWLAMDGR